MLFTFRTGSLEWISTVRRKFKKSVLYSQPGYKKNPSNQEKTVGKQPEHWQAVRSRLLNAICNLKQTALSPLKNNKPLHSNTNSWES